MTTAPHAHKAPTTHGHTIRWWAPAYEAVGWLMTMGQKPAMTRRAVAIARLQPGESILDVGCGPGSLTLPAAEKVGPTGKAAGIDASPEMIETARRSARKRGRDVDFQLAPIEALPFADSTFDAVLSSLMMHHLPDDLKAQGLAEIARVLKPGGRLVVMDLSGDRSPANLALRLVGHKTPADYVERLQSMILAAGFASDERVKSKWREVAFIRAYAAAEETA
jgi:demethylmenaquinone methyltransferase/2-methoxy-6-polyprenyl-1,4-benzoquinol methylase/phosphoethanolamine N-methyltransferase